MNLQKLIKQKNEELRLAEYHLREFKDYSHTDFIQTLKEQQTVQKKIKSLEEKVESIRGELEILKDMEKIL